MIAEGTRVKTSEGKVGMVIFAGRQELQISWEDRDPRAAFAICYRGQARKSMIKSLEVVNG